MGTSETLSEAPLEMKISAIMPAYNEEARIRDSLSSVKAHLDSTGMQYEIIVVDDGSKDRTREIASSAFANPHFKVTGYGVNYGKGYALAYGTGLATGDVIVFIDSDAEVSPDRIHSYVRALRNADIVVASKRHPLSKAYMPPVRRILSRAFHSLVRLLTGLRVSDTQSGLKVFRAPALRAILPKLSVKRFAFDVELLTVARQLGYRIVEMPVTINMTRAPEPLKMVRMLLTMLYEVLGITYRLRIRKSYAP